MENNEKVTFQWVFSEKQRENMLYDGFPRFPRKRQNLEDEKVIVFLINTFLNCAFFRRQASNQSYDCPVQKRSFMSAYHCGGRGTPAPGERTFGRGRTPALGKVPLGGRSRPWTLDDK